MRAVIQRVERAKITVKGQEISSIDKGLLVFLGIEAGDNHHDAEYLLAKIVSLRIFDDNDGKMNLSIINKNAAMLIVSQFTILGDCRRGRRPSFTMAAEPQEAFELYEYFLKKASEQNVSLSYGKFQALMKIELVNDGPVTIILDSKKRF